MDSLDRLYYLCREDLVVRLFDTQGQTLGAVDLTALDPPLVGSFDWPYRLYMDSADWLYISTPRRVYSLNQHLVQQRVYNITVGAYGFAVDRAYGLLYCEGLNGGLVHFNLSTGQLTASVNLVYGTPCAVFGMALDNRGRVHIADSTLTRRAPLGPPRILLFDPSLGLVTNFTAADGFNSFWLGLSINRANSRVFVADYGGINIFDAFDCIPSSSSSSSSSSSGISSTSSSSSSTSNSSSSSSSSGSSSSSSSSSSSTSSSSSSPSPSSSSSSSSSLPFSPGRSAGSSADARSLPIAVVALSMALLVAVLQLVFLVFYLAAMWRRRGASWYTSRDGRTELLSVAARGREDPLLHYQGVADGDSKQSTPAR